MSTDNVLQHYQEMFICRKKKCKQQQEEFLKLQKQHNEKVLALYRDTKIDVAQKNKIVKKMEKLLSKTQAALDASACLIAMCEKETIRLLDAISKEPIKKCGKEHKALCIELNKTKQAKAKQANITLQAIRKKDTKAPLHLSTVINNT